jgi:adenylate cyclase
MAYAEFFAEHFEEALSAANRALQVNPRFSVPYYLQTAAVAQLGRDEEAAISARRLLELQPGFTITSLVAGGVTSAERLDMLGRAAASGASARIRALGKVQWR